jgi:hypothetical protein
VCRVSALDIGLEVRVTKRRGLPEQRLFSGRIAATSAFYGVLRIGTLSRGVGPQLRECRRVQLDQPLA